MPMPPDFAQQSMYTEDSWFIHDFRIESDSHVVGVCDTTRLGSLVAAQREWPNHPKHLPGAIAIQITGTLGQLFASYVLNMSATEGWVGFGTHIHFAKFRRIGEIGPPVDCHARLLKNRTVMGTVFTRFEFRYLQAGEEVYHSEQTAAWVQSDHRGPLDS